MSYCRWSSDDFDCDVYVYESVGGGWTTHIANNRAVFDRSALPPPVPLGAEYTKDELTAFAERYRQLVDAVGTADRVPIGLPHDGATFSDPTPGECAKRLVWLRDAGYQVPQYAIDDLLAEHEEAE
jgi:hypothetical protein